MRSTCVEEEVHVGLIDSPSQSGRDTCWLTTMCVSLRALTHRVRYERAWRRRRAISRGL
jgi:hypothetical protein